MGRRRKRGFRSDELLQGVLLVDKPAGMTSHDVCQKVRYALRLGKVGHGGTLDPFATGLLPLMLNGATRLMPYVQTQDKGYDAVVRLGITTDTLDPDGEVTGQADASGLDDDAIRACVAEFVGPQTQTIPAYSAKRVDGKHLYEYARAGEEVELPTKDIVIHSIDIHSIERVEPETVDVALSVHCSVGTYVRTLAADIGSKLGVGGHLFSLRRTKAGQHVLDGAIPLDRILDQAAVWRDERTAQADAGNPVRFEAERNARVWKEFLADALRPVEELVGAPVVTVPEELVEAVQGGSPLRRRDVEAMGVEPFRPGDRLVLRHPDGLRSVALVKAKVASGAMGRLSADGVVLQVERVLR